MRGRLPLAMVFVVFLLAIAGYGKGQGVDEQMLVNLLPSIDDIPVPDWFDIIDDEKEDYSSGYMDFEGQTYAIFSGEKETKGKVNLTTHTWHYEYEQCFDISIGIYVTNKTWYSSKYGRDVFTTESDLLFYKEYYTTGNGSKKYGYSVYEMDDEHIIVYRNAEEAIYTWEDVYGVDYEAYYFSKIRGYGVLIKFKGLLYTSFDFLNWSREYEISPETFIADDDTCLKFLKNYFDEYANEVFEKLDDMLKEYVPSEVTILYEYDFDYSNGQMLTVGWSDHTPDPFPLYNLSVEVMGSVYYPQTDITGRIDMDELFNTSYILFDGETYKIKLAITTTDSKYEERTKTNELLPREAVIECYVEIDDIGRIDKVTIKKAHNCWIDTGNGLEILYTKNGFKEVDATDGFKIKVRGLIAWEKLIKYSIYKFLEESNFYSSVSSAGKFDLAMINSIPIYYSRGLNPGYDPTLNIINMSDAPGNIYTYDSAHFDTIFHEYAHAIKEHPYHFVDEDVDSYLGGGHGSTCDESNIYFAFEEGHSEFFASLMVDYVKEKKLIEDVFLADTDYYTSSCHYGKEGDKVEGAVAGLLLNGLYLDYTKYEYSNPQAKAYGIFAKACELCHKYLKHYPYSIHDVLPFIVAVEPNCEDSLEYWDIVKNYNCGITQHISMNPDKNGLYGYPVLVAVEPSWRTSIEINVNGTKYTVEEPDYGAFKVDDGMACIIFIEKNTEITADFSQGGGVYIILLNLQGKSMEEILAMKYGWTKDAIIEFEKDGIKVKQGEVVVKSNAGVTYKAGDKIKIIPHSEFILEYFNNTANIYVLEGLIETANEFIKEEISKGYKAIISNESIDISKYESKELDELWNMFGDALQTLNIEKEEGNGGKQPGFEIIVIATAVLFVAAMKRRRKK